MSKIDHTTITTKYMHKALVDKLTKAIELNKDKLERYLRVIEDAKFYFKALEDRIYLYANRSYEACVNIITRRTISSIAWKEIPVNELAFKKDRFVRTLSIMVTVNNDVVRVKREIKDDTRRLISYTLYKKIIVDMNERVIGSIIKTGVALQLGSYKDKDNRTCTLGYIDIVRKPRGRSIDWPKTMKNKRNLIERGITPYHEKDAPKGTKFGIYRQDSYGYWWYWAKYNCNCTNRQQYKFAPTPANIKLLFHYIDAKPEVVAFYRDAKKVLNVNSNFVYL